VATPWRICARQPDLAGMTDTNPPVPAQTATPPGRSWAAAGLVIAVLIIAADQASKFYVTQVLLADGVPVRVTAWLNIILVTNKGVSFSLFNEGSQAMRWILTVVALGIALILAIWLFRAHGWFTSLALGMIIGGAIGNAIDRIRIGAVIDFVDFHVPAWNDWHFATFNVADSAISTGVFLLLAAALFGGRESRR
jgi:signal peptidase II